MFKAKRLLACALMCMVAAAPVSAEETVPVSPAGSDSAVPVVTAEPELADLSMGAKGESVLRMQKRLAELGFFFTAEDGIYGANTKNAVKEFENYLRMLEQDEIDRLIEVNKTPEPTMTPEPAATAEPEMTPEASTPEDGELQAEITSAPTIEPTATPEPTPVPTPIPTPETQADGLADTAVQEILFADADSLYRRDAKNGDRGEDVLRIQRRLVYLNYLNDEPDYRFGVNTETALRAFQLAHDLNATGVADRATQAILFSEDAVRAEKPVYNQLYLWTTGNDVKEVQKQLRLLGFTNSKASGTFDENTEAAVRLLETYLHELDMKENGVVVVTVTSTPVPEEILDQQGQIVGDPESNPYEVSTDRQGTEEEDKAIDAQKPGLADEPEAGETPEVSAPTEPETSKVPEVSASDEPEAGETPEVSASTEPETSKVPEVSASDEPEASETPEVSAFTEPETGETPEASASTEPEASETPVPEATNAPAETAVPVFSGIVPVNPNPSGSGAKKVFEPTGVMTAEMQIRLLEEGIPVYMQTVQRGSSGDQVKRVQRRLYALGYLTANGVDGIYGAGTQSAVSAFQRRNKLTETGIADREMQTILFSEDAVKAIKPYQIEISLKEQRVYVYTHDDKDQYNIEVKKFICSTGLNETPTPKGTFTNTGPGARWHYFKKFECWAQYAYYINGDIMFHSVLYDEQDVDTLRQGSVSALGSKASHGCVRLKVEDAKWIYENCRAGTTIIVY